MKEPKERTETRSSGTGSEDVFSFFNEIGILSQLSSALFARTLPDGIHPAHFAILNHLVRTGDSKTPIRIANAMQVTKATMTHSLKVLKKRGFIAVRPNPEDSRGKLVFLTQEGRDFRDAAIERVLSRFADLFDASQIRRMNRMKADLVALREHLDVHR